MFIRSITQQQNRRNQLTHGFSRASVPRVFLFTLLFLFSFLSWDTLETGAGFLFSHLCIFSRRIFITLDELNFASVDKVAIEPALAGTEIFFEGIPLLSLCSQVSLHRQQGLCRLNHGSLFCVEE